MKHNTKKGIAIPIVLAVVLMFGCYVVSLSLSMSNSISRYEKTLNNRKAYFMARSGIEHMMLKIKTMQRHCSDSILTMEKAILEDVAESEKQYLFSVFKEDIKIPPDNDLTSDKCEYYIDKFKIESVDLESSSLTLEIEAIGKYFGSKNSIKRLVRISR